MVFFYKHEVGAEVLRSDTLLIVWVVYSCQGRKKNAYRFFGTNIFFLGRECWVLIFLLKWQQLFNNKRRFWQLCCMCKQMKLNHLLIIFEFRVKFLCFYDWNSALFLFPLLIILISTFTCFFTFLVSLLFWKF